MVKTHIVDAKNTEIILSGIDHIYTVNMTANLYKRDVGGKFHYVIVLYKNKNTHK